MRMRSWYEVQPGREQRVGGARAVDPRVDEAERAEAQARRRGRCGERELAAQQRHGAVDLARDADHPRLEVGAVDARLDRERVAPLRPARRGRDAHREAAPLARVQCAPAPRRRSSPRRRPAPRACSSRPRAPLASWYPSCRAPGSSLTHLPASAGCRMPARRAARAGYWDSSATTRVGGVRRRWSEGSAVMAGSFRRRLHRRSRGPILKRFTAAVNARLGRSVDRYTIVTATFRTDRLTSDAGRSYLR